jgi:hypothetical protein
MHALAATWLWLAPPVTDELDLAMEAAGAADNFVRDARDRRWTRHTARLRLRPRTSAAAYDVTVHMGSPPPSPLVAPEVVVTGPGGEEATFTVDRAQKPYRLRVTRPADGVLRLSIRAPSWNRVQQPPDQGVVVSRVELSPTAP